VSHLALYGTYARLTRTPDYPEGFGPRMFENFDRIISEQWSKEPGLDVLAPSLRGNSQAEAAWGRLIRAGTSPGGAIALMGLYRQLDVREALPLVGVPTLVLNREADEAVPPRLGRYVAERIPGARYVETPGQDHAFFVGGADRELDEIQEFLTGARPKRPPQRVLSTVLFTDIVRSTERAAELGDRRWRELLDRHDELVRQQVERHEGRAIKSTGDGVLATFNGPARGIGCATTIAEQIGELGLEVRAGLHTGECELREGDLGGLAVHIGARVAERAGPGEVLVSRTVRDLVVGSGIEFEDRGTAALKGVPGEWELYAVCG
jgi:class 3 adenylate cyclase